MRETPLTIEKRFCGPPASGNGGYVCGRLAAFVAGPARVRLSRPIPLERPLRVVATDAEARLFDGETLLATAVPATVPLKTPPPPTLARARAASAAYPGFRQHPFDTCFVCGPKRAAGDGLRVFPGAADGIVAAPFQAPADLLDENGHLRPEHVWAALDCPGYFAVAGDTMEPMLLGELAAAIVAPVPAGPLVAFAWPGTAEGRKRRCGSALATPDGAVLAVATGTWIRPA